MVDVYITPVGITQMMKGQTATADQYPISILFSVCFMANKRKFAEKLFVLN
jgi:hypothetical protein